MEPVPALVRLHVWRLRRGDVARALVHGLDRPVAGVRFSKLLGTGAGFLPGQADITRWARLTTWSHPGPDPVAATWSGLATETWQVDLRPLSSRGRWSRREPFGRPTGTPDGRVAVLTRARIRPRTYPAFYRAVRPVAVEISKAVGVHVSLPVGEAPIGLQGTFSIWESATHLRTFALAGAHREVITRTPEVGWYAEELFARFAVVASTGTLDGRDPLA